MQSIWVIVILTQLFSTKMKRLSEPESEPKLMREWLNVKIFLLSLRYVLEIIFYYFWMKITNFLSFSYGIHFIRLNMLKSHVKNLMKILEWEKLICILCIHQWLMNIVDSNLKILCHIMQMEPLSLWGKFYYNFSIKTDFKIFYF